MRAGSPQRKREAEGKRQEATKWIWGEEPGHSFIKKRQMQLVIINPTPFLNVLICNQCCSSLLFLFLPESFWSLISSRSLTISFCLNVTSFPAVLKKVNKKSFKNKMQQPHFMIYYYIYSIYIYLYINTYINILHVQPIVKRGGRENPKVMRTYGGGGSGATRPMIAHCEGSVSFCLRFVLALHTHTHAHTHTAVLGDMGTGCIPQFAQYGELP